MNFVNQFSFLASSDFFFLAIIDMLYHNEPSQNLPKTFAIIRTQSVEMIASERHSKDGANY